ncbi:MAG: YkgJ family cysteine cluster protein [Candidatus Margulisiibacteriota bacterium]|jgi:hypothetical protein
MADRRSEIEFSCTACGACCDRDGWVFLTLTDVQKLQEHFKLSPEEFKAQYLSKYGRYTILKEHPKGGCWFAHTAEGKCPIYEVRPEQCRTYPYWPDHYHDPDWFKGESKECPGIKVL